MAIYAKKPPIPTGNANADISALADYINYIQQVTEFEIRKLERKLAAAEDGGDR